MDLFISAGEISGDLHGSKLIEKIHEINPSCAIGAVAGPKMRQCAIQEFFKMEDLLVMGFIDVVQALPRLYRQFFAIRNQIVRLNPKVVVLIDYPGLHLRLAKSLKKQGFLGKIVHYICPTVWAWKKNRIFFMETYLDHLLTIFPFELKCFENTTLSVEYVGHPLVPTTSRFQPSGKFQGKILALFPGSRKAEIERNLPLQLKVAKRLQALDPELQIILSKSPLDLDIPGVQTVPPEDNYELMSAALLAIATSGTVTLELALMGVPTVVNFAIRPMDCWIAKNIFRIHLPFYCIVNILLEQEVFPELFGPHFTEEALFYWSKKFWGEESARKHAKNLCKEVRKYLGIKDASKEAAKTIVSFIDF
ncbi:MAG: lipid-A-disaccharide synthase [Chlamydiae bacterium RIFCSPHIGHO2_12_FULL_44_59]|nr:MAG: lipid-A-disaccharide synthase [Chlamydiae bacterium RIFCSPHIGHO2_01_FULL_44_39]OGN59141.1 MAG: lipid-A-disaccharide synthase [Chlamydiae bacterium RIFCSPHIGHO2_02_FULL_45_9]OGN60903.1 MAG: lipid-A-disaccharide synthase [Chlamydiae bacterium RIFCSPHIGHO2_12_FULL_44_59]OGN66489.1 MAG: lipid-A-disaccharide synthase [Chlamydiae bacterium RIFCSPLOWO2_01_FULL_44_52]OGN70006.1 MAG: lipid-A-disaccharide synthase [Chlamydiae bacterium RIFCSPLOWO2_02_FULL_45_22]OGN71079.1 MAG: lipid-A-disacchari